MNFLGQLFSIVARLVIYRVDPINTVITSGAMDVSEWCDLAHQEQLMVFYLYNRLVFKIF